jgi:hypothetical protein
MTSVLFNADADLEARLVQKKTFTDTALTLALGGLFVSFVVSLAWVLRLPEWQQASVILSFAAVTFGLSAVKQARLERRIDEVELAALRFGSRWGFYAGIAVLSLVFFLPPFQSFLIGVEAWFENSGSGHLPIPARMFLLGIVSTFVVQETARALITAGWKWSKR